MYTFDFKRGVGILSIELNFDEHGIEGKFDIELPALQVGRLVLLMEKDYQQWAYRKFKDVVKVEKVFEIPEEMRGYKYRQME